MTIRIFEKSDYDNVFDMWLHTKGMGLNETDDSREGIEKYLDRNPRTSFVAVEDDKIVGVIMCGHDGRRGFIHHTAVLDDYRRRGIATALVNTALEALKKEGINKAVLVVMTDNESGNAFWEHYGFKTRDDLNYRNRALAELKAIKTGK